MSVLRLRLGNSSIRGRLLAVFVVCAIVLGGGGTPNPATELVLQILFCLFAVAWLWMGRSGRVLPDDKLIFLVLASIVAVPLLQLVPLPPSLWTALPGREQALTSLSLVNAQESWSAVSLSPSRTLASLLAMVPALGVAYATAALDQPDRRLALLAIVAMAIVTALVGSLQLSSGGAGISLYDRHHVGWVTGFQANRNATADVLLVAVLSLAVISAPYLGGGRERLPLGLGKKAFTLLCAVLGLVIVLTIVMTGSRTGTLLIIPALFFACAIYLLDRDQRRTLRLRPYLVAALAAGVVVFALGLTLLSQDAAIGRVADRFSDLRNTRAMIWADSWVALQKYWPVGFGLGGFVPAMLPQERLEFLDATFPNRAHNDFLEVGIEAGLVGYLFLALCAVAILALAWRAWRSSSRMRPDVAFGISVLLLIAMHSVVDYPLRSMAVACLAGLAVGMLVRVRAPGQQPHDRFRDERMKGSA